MLLVRNGALPQPTRADVLDAVEDGEAASTVDDVEGVAL